MVDKVHKQRSTTREERTQYQTGVYQRRSLFYLNFYRKNNEFHASDLSKFLDDPTNQELGIFHEVDQMDLIIEGMQESDGNPISKVAL